jgi:hypothetical protein
MEPRTQVIAGNCAGVVAIASTLVGIAGMVAGILALALFLPLSGVALYVRLRLESRQDQIKIDAGGEVYVNGHLTTLARLPKDLRLGDPYLTTEPRGGGIAAVYPQLQWMVWVERAYDQEHVPDQAVRVFALLQDNRVPFSCTWGRGDG